MATDEQHRALQTLIEQELIGVELAPSQPSVPLPPGPVHAGAKPPPLSAVASMADRPLSRRYRIVSVIALAVVGWGLWNLGQDEGRTPVLGLGFSLGLIAAVLFYATAIGAGGRRAKWAAIVGVLTLYLETAVIALLAPH
jgi:hypothetical protein